MVDYPLRGLVAAMARPDVPFDACEAALGRMAEVIGLPHIGLVPDVARPYLDAEADAFFRRHDWPAELLTVWWAKRGPIKTRFYARARLAAVPFIVSLEDALPVAGSADERDMTRLFLRHGLVTVVGVPVHRPRGQIALLVFAGRADAAALRNDMGTWAPDVAAGGLFTMAAWDRRRFREGMASEDTSRLTQREWDCLRLMAQGCRDAEIAAMSGIAATTVRYHVDNLIEKLGAVNRVHAVARACQLGLVGPIGL